VYHPVMLNHEPTQRATYTVKEAARLHGISRGLCYEAIRRGEVPSIRIGRRLLVPKEDLRRLVSSRARSAASPGAAG
jgi:excisionase family DNA binding protein